MSFRVELAEVARYAAPRLVVFCGSDEHGGIITPLAVRTTRALAFIDDVGRWQIRHIDPIGGSSRWPPTSAQ